MEDEIYNIIKKNDFDNFQKVIKNLDNLNIKLKNDNFILNELIILQNLKMIKFFLSMENVNTDILDNEGRTILYYPIKNKNEELLDLLIEFDEKNIGISIFDKLDSENNISLYYAIIENNITFFKKLLKKSNIFNLNEDDKNVMELCFDYNRNEMIIKLIEIIPDINILNYKGENILQVALNYNNFEIVNYILEKEVNVNNADFENGLTALHHAIIIDKRQIIEKIIKKGGDINYLDNIGNSPFHYAVIEKNINLIEYFINETDVKFNLLNLNGNIPIMNYFNVNLSNENSREFELLLKFFKNTNLNIINNEGNTPLHLLVEKYLWEKEKIYSILKKKKINVFISNNNNETVYDLILNKDKIINLVSESYYYLLQKNKSKIKNNWEKKCSTQDYQMIKDNDDKEKCITQIKKYIVKNKVSIPNFYDYIINIDSGIFVNTCYYTGSTIDILFGLLYLKNNFNNLSLILEYPLSINEDVVNTYRKFGINYSFKLEFLNISIMWVFQKIIYPTNFDYIENKDFEYLIIPISIETEVGAHANMLFYDKKNKIIERFEPNGKNFPRGLNYNPDLLDSILENKFKSIDNDIEYRRPKNYLPIIGFQFLETLENRKCRRIGDPNGFCAVWCIWWIEQKIKNIKIESSILAEKLIERTKLNNFKFKNLIRNYSKNITDLRDNYLQKYNLDINDWINKNYTEDIIEKLENDISSIINY